MISTRRHLLQLAYTVMDWHSSYRLYILASTGISVGLNSILEAKELYNCKTGVVTDNEKKMGKMRKNLKEGDVTLI